MARSPKEGTPNEPKPWALLGYRSCGDGSVEPIYAAVGKALSQWEELENRLASLFAFFVGDVPGDDAPAVRAYGTVISFRSRCGMVNAAARAYFHKHPDEGLEAKWTDLRKQLEGYSERRNDIAHGAARMLINPRSKEGPHGAYLTPGLFVSKKFPLDREWPTQYFLTADQIESFSASFFSLANRIVTHRTILERRRPLSSSK